MEAAAIEAAAAKARIVHGTVFESDIAQRALDQIGAAHAAIRKLAAAEMGFAEVCPGKVTMVEHTVQKFASAMRMREYTSFKPARIGTQGLSRSMHGVEQQVKQQAVFILRAFKGGGFLMDMAARCLRQIRCLFQCLHLYISLYKEAVRKKRKFASGRAWNHV